MNVFILFYYVTFAEDTRFAEMFRQPVGGQFFMDGNRMSGNQRIQGQMIGGQMVGGQMVGGQMVGGQMVGGQIVGGQMVGGQMVGGQMVGTQSVAGLRTIKKSKLVYYLKSVLSRLLSFDIAFNIS